MGGQRHAPAALTPVKTLYQLYRRRGGSEGRSGQMGKIPTMRIRSPDRPVRSEWLYWLSYPGQISLTASLNEQTFFRSLHISSPALLLSSYSPTFVGAYFLQFEPVSVKQHRRELMWFYILEMYLQDVTPATKVLVRKPTWTTTVGSWTHKTRSTRARSDESRWQQLQQRARM